MKRKIKGHVMYLGPHIGFLGLGYSKLWRDGIDEQLYPWIEQCPALGSLFVPVADIGKVRKELNFDYAHQMRGTTGRFVTFYREVQKWLASQTAQQPMKVEHHHV